MTFISRNAANNEDGREFFQRDVVLPVCFSVYLFPECSAAIRHGGPNTICCGVDKSASGVTETYSARWNIARHFIGQWMFAVGLEKSCPIFFITRILFVGGICEAELRRGEVEERITLHTITCYNILVCSMEDKMCPLTWAPRVVVSFPPATNIKYVVN